MLQNKNAGRQCREVQIAVISSNIRSEIGKPQFDCKIRHLEAYDGHHLTLLGSLTGYDKWNGSRHTQKQLEGRDYLVETFYLSMV